MPSSGARRRVGQVVDVFWTAMLTSGGSRETPTVECGGDEAQGCLVDFGADEGDPLREMGEGLAESLRCCGGHRGR